MIRLDWTISHFFILFHFAAWFNKTLLTALIDTLYPPNTKNPYIKESCPAAKGRACRLPVNRKHPPRPSRTEKQKKNQRAENHPTLPYRPSLEPLYQSYPAPAPIATIATAAMQKRTKSHVLFVPSIQFCTGPLVHVFIPIAGNAVSGFASCSIVKYVPFARYSTSHDVNNQPNRTIQRKQCKPSSTTTPWMFSCRPPTIKSILLPT